MKKISIAILLICLVFNFSSCKQKDNEYKKQLDVKVGPAPQLVFDRYEDVLFHLDTACFQQELMRVQQNYKPFLGGDLTNPAAVKYLKDFATDPYCISMYDKVKAAFPNNKDLEDMVSSVYQHFNYYYPDIQLPTKIYTCVSGISPDNASVMVNDDNVVLSLDWFLDHDEVYEQIGMPVYMQNRTTKMYLAKELSFQLYLKYIYQWRKQTNLLDEMVNMGKVDYFVEAMCPSLPEEVLLGYSADQMQWANENEGNVWADLVGNQRLYETGLEMYRTFFADGPFTQEYSNEAPARLGEFIGLHIVRSYMSVREDMSLQNLMKNNDLQGIFQNSKYKPKK